MLEWVRKTGEICVGVIRIRRTSVLLRKRSSESYSKFHVERSCWCTGELGTHPHGSRFETEPSPLDCVYTSRRIQSRRLLSSYSHRRKWRQWVGRLISNHVWRYMPDVVRASRSVVSVERSKKRVLRSAIADEEIFCYWGTLRCLENGIQSQQQGD